MPREEIGRRECKRIIDRRNQGRQEGKEGRMIGGERGGKAGMPQRKGPRGREKKRGAERMKEQNEVG